MPMIKTWPSIIWMWPRVARDGYNVWGNTTAFVRTPTKNYTLGNLNEFASDLPGGSILIDTFESIINTTLDTTIDPGVKTLCMFANDTKTDLSVSVPSLNPVNRTKSNILTWGDGTVNLQSLEACARWKNVTVRPIKFGGSLAAHTEIVSNPEVLEKVVHWAMGQPV